MSGLSSHRLEGLGLAGGSRNITDDALSDHEDDGASCADAAALTWTDARVADARAAQEGGLRVRQLVIGGAEAADAFLACAFATFTEVGAIAAESATEPRWSLRVDAGALGGGDGAAVALDKMVVVISSSLASGTAGSAAARVAATRGKKGIARGDEWRWVEPLMQNIVADQVVVLDTVKVSAVPLVSAAEGKPQAPFLFQIGTSAFVAGGQRMAAGAGAAKTGVSLAAVPDLPSPILLEGPGAAALTLCEARGANAVALVSLVERTIDSSTLVAFETPFGIGGGVSDTDGERRARKLRYREAVKGCSKKLDGLYL